MANQANTLASGKMLAEPWASTRRDAQARAERNGFPRDSLEAALAVLDRLYQVAGFEAAGGLTTFAEQRRRLSPRLQSALDPLVAKRRGASTNSRAIDKLLRGDSN